MGVVWQNRCARCDRPSTRNVCKNCATQLSARTASSQGRQFADGGARPTFRRVAGTAAIARRVLTRFRMFAPGAGPLGAAPVRDAPGASIEAGGSTREGELRRNRCRDAPVSLTAGSSASVASLLDKPSVGDPDARSEVQA